MKVLFRFDPGPALQRRLAELSAEGLEVRHCPEGAAEGRFFDLLRDTEVLWHVLEPVTAAVLAEAPRLRLIQKIGVGVNTIDLETARARGIAVCNMPQTNSQAVAEMTLALMLAALRRLPAIDRTTRCGRGWDLPASVQDKLGEIGGRIVGLVGYGAVPARLAPVLRALGAQVLYTARTPKPEAAAVWRALPDLLAESDIVSLHVPLTAETEQLIDATAIARMKQGAVLVNTARGGLVDETALLAALSDGRLSAAGLDVFADEPVDADNPLLALDNVVLAPHLAWLTMETLARSLEVALDNCRRLAEGRQLRHRVI
jgi:phosphoglycerate dehydrogenase-like enzyme